MRRIMSRWVGLLAAASVLLIVGSAAAHVTPNVTTYTVQFKQMGLPGTISWTVTFNSVPSSGTGSTHKFTTISAGSYFWSITSPIIVPGGIQYVALTTGAYMSVPGQVTEIVQFQQQDQLTFAVSPVSSGTTTPTGMPYVNNNTAMAITAVPAVSYNFSTWTTNNPTKITFASATSASTVATIKGKGTITAMFILVKYHINFYETGLPVGHAWSVVFNGLTYIASHIQLVVAVQAAGYYSWTAGLPTSGTTVQYAPFPASGSMSVPSQTTQSVVYTKQDQVTFAVGGSGSGATTPSGTAFYNEGSQIAISATAYSYTTPSTKFMAWSANFLALKFGNTANDSTNLTIGSPGTVTATFTTGSRACPTPTCNVMTYETGLPSGTAWGITVGGIFYGTTGKSIKVTGVSNMSYFSWSTASPLGSTANPGIAYVPSATSGSFYVSYQTHQMIVFQTEDYLNIMVRAPAGGPGVGPASGWFVAGSSVAIWGVNYAAYDLFTSWTSNTTKLTFTVAKNASTFVVVGGPGTVFANFAFPLSKVTFTAFGLPATATWGVTFNSVLYLATTATLVIHGVPAYSSNYYYPMVYVAGATAGTAYFTATPSNYMATPYQTTQAISYVKVFLVNVTASNTLTSSGGTVTPGATPVWYQNGTVLFVLAINGSTGHFSAWSGSPGASFTIAATGQSATTVAIKGPGSIIGTFV
jgi:hypothetical protein